MKSIDKTGILVITIAIIVTTVGLTSIFATIYIEMRIVEIKQEQFVNLSEIEAIELQGMVQFIIDETNQTVIDVYGYMVHVSVSGSEELFYSFENITERDAELINKMQIGRNYTLTYIDFYSFSKTNLHCLPRNNLLVAVDEFGG